MTEQVYNMTSWLKGGFHPKTRSDLIKKATTTLRKYRRRKGKRFDAIACCGYSGLSVASVLSFVLNIPLIAVRKMSSHDDRMVFGLENANTYIIVDDFVASGRTVRNIHRYVSDFTTGKSPFATTSRGEPAKLLAVFTYERDYSGYRPYEKRMGNYCEGLRSGDKDLIEDVPLLDLKGLT